jgi:apolipoprotein N-acyltransferase
VSLFDKLRAVGLAIILSWGWKRAVIALLAGALSALAMAPFNAWPVLFVTFPVAVWLIDGAGAGRWRGVPATAMSGFWFGLGYFVPGLYWIGYAFLVDAPTFAWLMPFAVLGLPAYLALFPALGFALARLFWTKDATRVLALAISLTTAEWLRGHVLTGFPWNAFGYALTEPLALAQTASLIGLWGLTFLAVAIFASPAVLIDGRSRGRKPWLAPLAAVLLLAAMLVFGAARLALHPTATLANVKLRIMQPNLQQDVKFNYAAKAEVMQKYLTLSDRASGPQSTGVSDAQILIWPESAFPFFLTREADAMAQIAELLPRGTVLMTGSVRAPDVPPGARITRAFDLCHRPTARAVSLRQASSGAVWRISAVPGADGEVRVRAADKGHRRIHPGHTAPRDGHPERAGCAAHDLLRSDFSWRCCGPRRPPWLDHQSDQ